MRFFRFSWCVIERFIRHDGYALASHLALSCLTALFPFLIFVAALAGVVGAGSLQDEIVRLLFEAWPQAVAAPIAREVGIVLGVSRPGLVTASAITAIVMASNGFEAIRVGINRAYGEKERRPFWLCRLESLLLVLVASLVLITQAALALIWPGLIEALPMSGNSGVLITIARHAIILAIQGSAVALIHRYMAAGHRSFRMILPGTALTLSLWMACGLVFGRYISEFNSYSIFYAGLGGVFAALFFLWLVAVSFLIGAEFNAVLAASRKNRTISGAAH